MTNIPAKIDEEIAQHRLLISRLTQIGKEAAWGTTIRQLEVDALTAECTRLEAVNAELLAACEQALDAIGALIGADYDLAGDRAILQAAIKKAKEAT